MDEYVCTLSYELRKVAFAEWGETDELRLQGIKEMRDWIMANPRIVKCRMDSKFILKFLRFRKFNMPRVKEAFERYLVFHEAVYGYDWFSHLDINQENIQKILQAGGLTILPNRDVNGCKVFLIRYPSCKFDYSTLGNNLMSMITMVFETLQEDEENQILGFSYIFDVSTIRLKFLFLFPMRTWFRFGKNSEVTLRISS